MMNEACVTNFDRKDCTKETTWETHEANTGTKTDLKNKQDVTVRARMQGKIVT
jgi:hypothetical protein